MFKKYWRNELIEQLIRYAIVGVVINSTGFVIYLFLTWLGLNPILTMSCLYCIAVTISFFGSKNIAFNHEGSHATAAARYFIAHLGGYGMNLSLLLFFHDYLAWPHQWVQAGATVVVALYLFVAFKLFVFRVRS
ncbi:GtrA family protein [Pseudomonas sp. O230]|uniref:GtrA family protein n=1 Tax=Pseudomonas sp. O230 TaxID=3159450 RepID=UPI00387B8314